MRLTSLTPIKNPPGKGRVHVVMGEVSYCSNKVAPSVGTLYPELQGQSYRVFCRVDPDGVAQVVKAALGVETAYTRAVPRPALQDGVCSAVIEKTGCTQLYLSDSCIKISPIRVANDTYAPINDRRLISRVADRQVLL